MKHKYEKQREEKKEGKGGRRKDVKEGEGSTKVKMSPNNFFSSAFR